MTQRVLSGPIADPGAARETHGQAGDRPRDEPARPALRAAEHGTREDYERGVAQPIRDHRSEGVRHWNQRFVAVHEEWNVVEVVAERPAQEARAEQAIRGLPALRAKRVEANTHDEVDEPREARGGVVSEVLDQRSLRDVPDRSDVRDHEGKG